MRNRNPRTARKSSRIAIISVLLLGAIIFLAVSYTWNTATSIFQPADSTGTARSIPLTVTKGETTAQIADDLQTKGLIKNALAFRIWARIKGLDTQLQAGVYKHLTTSMTISDIIDQLLNAQPDAINVAVIEGWRIEQIANQLAGQGLAKFSKTEFLGYVKHPGTFPDFAKYSSILKYIPHGDGMEGLLFPATYDIPVDATARDVVNLMLKTFNENVSPALVAQAHAHKLSEYQMVILASLTQREVVHIKDASGVARVYLNRTLNDVPNDTAGYLGSDPSVEYARDTENPPAKYWQPLQDSGGNIAPNSPWNTYKNQGFPPTPICSPGLAALQAAANPDPKESNDFYFLSTKDGTIVYARTYKEFQALEAKYLK